MNLNFLRTFVCVVEEGNFSRAACRLHLSQPAVSMQMQALAQELGVELFHRRGHRVEATEAGTVLYEQTSEMLRAWQDTVHQLEGLRLRLQGRLELGASTVPGDYLLPGRLCSFYRKHPDVEVRMTVAPSQDIINSLVSGRLDVAVVGFQPKNNGLKSEVLFQDELVVVFSPDHSLAHLETVSPEDLLAQALIVRTPGSATRQVLEESLSSSGYNPGKLRIVMELGSGRAILEAAAQGLGVAVVSKLAATDFIDQGRLAWRPVSHMDVQRSFWLVQTDRPRSPALKVFVDSLRRGDNSG